MTSINWRAGRTILTVERIIATSPSFRALHRRWSSGPGPKPQTARTWGKKRSERPIWLVVHVSTLEFSACLLCLEKNSWRNASMYADISAHCRNPGTGQSRRRVLSPSGEAHNGRPELGTGAEKSEGGFERGGHAHSQILTVGWYVDGEEPPSNSPLDISTLHVIYIPI